MQNLTVLVNFFNEVKVKEGGGGGGGCQERFVYTYNILLRDPSKVVVLHVVV